MGNINFEINNFRNFRKPTKFKFAPISILIGPNNSGKSSAIKSLLFLKDNMVNASFLPKNLKFGSNETNFKGINDINNSDETIDYSFKIKPSYFSLFPDETKGEFTLDISYSKDYSKDNYEVSGVLILKSVQINYNDKKILRFDNYHELVFNLDFDLSGLIEIYKSRVIYIQNTIKTELKNLNTDFEGLKDYEQQKLSPFDSDFHNNEGFDVILKSKKYKYLVDHLSGHHLIDEKDLENPLELLFVEVNGKNNWSDEDKGEFGWSQIEVFEAFQKHLDDEYYSPNDRDDQYQFEGKSRIKFEAIEKGHENVYHSIKRVFCFVEEELRRIGFKYFNDKNIEIEGIGFTTLFEGISRMFKADLMELTSGNNIQKIEKIPSIKTSSSRFVSLIQNESFLAKALSSYRKCLSLRSRTLYLTKDWQYFMHDYLPFWLNEFGIGKNLLLSPEDMAFENDIFTAYVTQDDNTKTNLINMGTGVGQVISLILLPFYVYDNYGFPKDKCYFKDCSLYIEEPETNLHPLWQSKLMDLLVCIWEKFGITFIIESHSEYMVRKLQYLTANKELLPEHSVIYYFCNPNDFKEGEPQIRELKIRKDGILDGEFGNGFYDEATRLTVDLLKLQNLN